MNDFNGRSQRNIESSKMLYLEAEQGFAINPLTLDSLDLILSKTIKILIHHEELCDLLLIPGTEIGGKTRGKLETMGWGHDVETKNEDENVPIYL